MLYSYIHIILQIPEGFNPNDKAHILQNSEEYDFNDKEHILQIPEEINSNDNDHILQIPEYSNEKEPHPITYSCCIYNDQRYSGKYYLSAVVSSNNFSHSKQGDSFIASKKIENEAKYLRNLQHDNILHFAEVHHSTPPLLLTEEIRFSLFDYIETVTFLEEREKLHIANEVICGLVYLHENKSVAHLNLTTKSIVITAKSAIKISNFEYARSFDTLQNALFSENDVLRESRDEVSVFDFLPQDYLHCLGGSADIFSFGCVVLNVYSLQWPEPTHGPIEDMTEIDRRIMYFSDIHEPSVKDIIQICFSEHPTSMEIHNRLCG